MIPLLSEAEAAEAEAEAEAVAEAEVEAEAEAETTECVGGGRGKVDGICGLSVGERAGSVGSI